MPRPRAGSVGAEVSELELDAVVALLEQRHHPLQLVLARGRDAHGVALDRGLHLAQLRLLDRLDDLARHVGVEPAGELQYLATRAAARLLEIAGRDVLERNPASHQL